jgi:predicted Zn-dependent protease with MMP-like domain
MAVMTDARTRRLEKAWEHFDQGEMEQALELAEALRAEQPDEPEATVLAAAARQELGHLEEALVLARRAAQLAPDTPFVRLTLASILYDRCEFDAGLEAVDQALQGDPENPYTHYLAGLLCDMSGRREDADACFRQAEQLDPEGFPMAPVIDDDGFRRSLAEAEAALPPEFRRHLRDVPIVVQDLPSRALLSTLEAPTPDLLGLFVGVPRTLKSTHDLPGPPDTIYLFKRNLERSCVDADDLAEQIGVTLLHELGHYLGMEEDDLDEAGYA